MPKTSTFGPAHTNLIDAILRLEKVRKIDEEKIAQLYKIAEELAIDFNHNNINGNTAVGIEVDDTGYPVPVISGRPPNDDEVFKSIELDTAIYALREYRQYSTDENWNEFYKQYRTCFPDQQDWLWSKLTPDQKSRLNENS